MTRTFVDVGVQRIGEYITRRPKLAAIRGASALLSEVTDEAAVLAALHDQGLAARTNPDVGRADGVVHLELDPEQDAELVATAVLSHLRDSLVGADLVASWACAPDYASAYLEMDAQRARGQALEWFPATAECPWLHPCQGCGRQPAIAVPVQNERLCPDCQARTAAAGRAAGVLRGRFGADLRFPGSELKELLPEQRTGGPTDNHIALVMADGNGVGALFAALVADPSVRTEQISQISSGLSEVTVGAFQAAARAIQRPDGVSPVIPILQGGDDLSAFVASGSAWQFTRTLIETFRERADVLMRDVLGGQVAASLPAISMSAGLVFLPVAFPAPQAFQHADSLMRAAKRIQGPAISWRDVTAHGQPTSGSAARPVLPMANLDGLDAQLRALAAVHQSARKGLARVLADLGGVGLDSDQTRKYLQTQAGRLGLSAQIEPFNRPDSAIDVAVALDLARWWQ